MKKVLIGLAVTVGILFIFALIVYGWVTGTYNSFVTKSQAVDAQWAQVENVYQRRADLVPNLVNTVKGYAAHEKGVFEAVTEARAKVGQIQIDPTKMTPEMLAQYQAAQGDLSQALSRLLLVVENYPQLKASENFLALQSQLEGTENRVAVERKRYNDVAQDYNTDIKKFPGSIIAGMSGFESKPYFKAEAGAEKAPKVDFSK